MDTNNNLYDDMTEIVNKCMCLLQILVNLRFWLAEYLEPAIEEGQYEATCLKILSDGAILNHTLLHNSIEKFFSDISDGNIGFFNHYLSRFEPGSPAQRDYIQEIHDQIVQAEQESFVIEDDSIKI